MIEQKPDSDRPVEHLVDEGRRFSHGMLLALFWGVIAWMLLIVAVVAALWLW